MISIIDVHDHDLTAAFRTLLGAILDSASVEAVLAPLRRPDRAVVWPTLVADPAQLARLDPLSPAFLLNTAELVGRLTRKAGLGPLAVMLRPCEIRAFIELVKLNQGRRQDVLIIGSDCLGAFSNKDYFDYVQSAGQAAGRIFYERMLAQPDAVVEGVRLAHACRTCESFLPAGADVAVRLYGVDTSRHVLIEAQTEKGAALLTRLKLAAGQLPPGRADMVGGLVERRTACRDAMLAETAAATGSLEKLSAYLARCVNCYNCRVACPVCYCRECVFTTDVFAHDPLQYLSWARRRGAVKLPTDTLFYHLTRMAHMSTSCVGCGQCANACPNGIDLMALFRYVAHRTQAAFDYRAGQDAAAKPPLTHFKEDEYQEVVGVLK